LKKARYTSRPMEESFQQPLFSLYNTVHAYLDAELVRLSISVAKYLKNKLRKERLIYFSSKIPCYDDRENAW
jgi:hypothetical protein